MWLTHWRRVLFVRQAEADEGFRMEIRRLSHLGLRVMGLLQIGVSLFMFAGMWIIEPDPRVLRIRAMQVGAVVGSGLMCLAMAGIRGLFGYLRGIAMASGVVTAAALIWSSLLVARVDTGAEDFIPGQMALVLLAMVSALPLRPAQAFGMAGVILAFYLVLAQLAYSAFSIGSGIRPIFVLFLVMLAGLATGLSAVLYEQRRRNHESHMASLRAVEGLRAAEARNLLSQTAASVGRLAAALSHELNSPIGALVSGVDTLLLLAARQATSPPEQHERLVRLQSDLRRSIRESSDRLRSVVSRMQRFTNLDRAEVQSVSLSEVMRDVAGLLQPQMRENLELELDLQEVEPTTCRPQSLAAVFSSLLQNAAQAVNGESGGRVRVATRRLDHHVEAVFEDNGRGVSPEALATIFDPGFKVDDLGHISTGNWSMFHAREIVREHGGDIRIQSEPGRGTRVTVTLPAVGLTESGSTRLK